MRAVVARFGEGKQMRVRAIVVAVAALLLVLVTGAPAILTCRDTRSKVPLSYRPLWLRTG